MNKYSIRDICFILFVGFLMLVLVNPVGNFPLNDDWQYARPVFYLIKKGYYYSPDLYSPVLAAQAIWGALFCIPLGFSFTTLRLSVFILGLAGVIVFYILVYNFSVSRKSSLICALLLLVNPLFFSLSNTFMTDVPFLSFTLFAVYFFSKAINTSQLKYIIPATIFSIFAILVRQFGVIVPIAYGVTQIIKNKPSLFRLVKYFLPALLAILALEFTIWRIKNIGSLTPVHDLASIRFYLSSPINIIAHIFVRSSCFLYYFGLFFLPVLLFTGPFFLKLLNSRQKKRVVILLILSIPFIIYGWIRFPYGNIINHGYIGPKTLRDVTFLHINDISPFLGILVSIIGLIGSVLFLISFAGMITNYISRVNVTGSNTSSQFKFLSLCAAGYSFLICIPGFFYDRYFLPVIIFILLLIVLQGFKEIEISAPKIYFSAVFILLMGMFSTFTTHDYLQWNRTRWDALSYLTGGLKISPQRIDGGYEFNGWVVGNNYVPNKNKSWWFVTDDEYMISFGSVPGYKILKEYPYSNYMPYGKKEIFILHRE
jgi:hypothetical protein